ncbi:S8 family peptidase [Haliscomenobacter sp.]|uniref:S8 family peptidase n=1 Tax=Haliscomenobacter sp. TaxID=2717303 RepID=UPI003593D344
MKRKFCTIVAFLIGMMASNLMAQAPQNWFHLDPSKDGVPGMATESIYKRLPKTKKGKTVIVAVIDSGVDYKHEDLKEVMWVNEDEIPNNGIDDDKNGYIDDIHGWSFLGNAKGENVVHDNLEVTRLYATLKKKFDGKDPATLSKKEKVEYAKYEEYKAVVEKGRQSAEGNLKQFAMVKEMYDQLVKGLGTDNPSLNDLKKFKTTDQRLNGIKGIFVQGIEAGETFKSMAGQILEAYDHYYGQLNYNYNPDYNPRTIVGDNYADVNERFYGNNDVKGPDSKHGTHVAGIIGAKRGNNIGMDGVADNVRIMSVRTVPDGDERDKDVANAIRYAVDNGATVINMSFGKGYSPQKAAVDAAVKYAQDKDVLLIHAAGNDGKNLDLTNNYPNDHFEKKGKPGKKSATNWVEVGALNADLGEHMAAEFSNYNPEYVDVFAPGAEIYATTPENTYENLQGTSMAAPMVAGVAAILRSYFPDLTADQVKEVLIASSVKQNRKVIKPGTEDEKVDFSTLGKSGGIVNVEKAVELAIKTVGKKKGVQRILVAGDLAPAPKVIP